MSKYVYSVSFVCEDLDHSLVSKFVSVICSHRAQAISYIRRQGVCIDYRVPERDSVRIPAFYKEGHFYSYLINKIRFIGYEKKKVSMASEASLLSHETSKIS